ncbi:MAG: hypothetical protein QJR03_03625 [Sphaerobacter sp.]|nr:hypothetical protein [Sphaerobacter sp.]
MHDRPKQFHSPVRPRALPAVGSGMLVGGLLLVASSASLLSAAPPLSVLLVLIGSLGLVLVARLAQPGGSLTANLDRTTRWHSRPAEWQALLDIERAQTAPERRLLLAREFRRLASEALAAPPTDRRRWPRAGRLAALRRQAALLRASATDRTVGFLPEPLPEDQLSQAVLAEAIQVLTAYLALLTTVRRAPTWDLEVVRVLVRERTRLEVALERVSTALREA